METPQGAPESLDLEKFYFRGLHPHVYLGTASDRYSGWLGQIYTASRYEGETTKRMKKLAGKSFREEVLPVESVAEYFQHFRLLEIDFTFYQFLLDAGGKPLANYHVLQRYCDNMREQDHVVVKAPQAICARNRGYGAKAVPNPLYLNVQAFTEQFYRPVTDLLGDRLAALVFEQEYVRKADHQPEEQLLNELGSFFTAIPQDDRYHLETRTESYLTKGYAAFLSEHGIGQVLSHWTWLPPLRKQFVAIGSRFYNRGGSVVFRLLTPRGLTYDQTYEKAFPFNELVPGMLDEEMIRQVVELIGQALTMERQSYVIVNNRAGGNAPLIAQKIARAVEVVIG